MPTWLIETDLNPACEAVATAAVKAGHRVIRWSTGDRIPRVPAPIFLGSLTECRIMPGVQGDPDRLRVSSWLPRVADLALNTEVISTTAGDVSPDLVSWPRVFARPDSAMKPFSGRVLDRQALSPAALDLGFYYDDPALPVVLAPAVSIRQEWRFVAVNGVLVAESGYRVDVGRVGQATVAPAEAVEVARQALMRGPEPTVVIDICELERGGFRLMEFNLFSGADLYTCDPAAIVEAFG